MKSAIDHFMKKKMRLSEDNPIGIWRVLNYFAGAASAGAAAVSASTAAA